MLHTQDILATAVSQMSFGTETSISLLSGASLPWREPSNQAQKEATSQYVTIGHSTTRRLPDVKTVASAPLDILETVCDVAREVMGTVIDTNAPLMSAGLDSLSATEFTNTLSERLNIEIQATALFDHPTLQSLADFLSSEFSNDVTEALPRGEEQPVAEVRVLETREERTITIAAWDFTLAGGITTPSELCSLSMRALEVNTDVPLARWATPTPGAKPSAAYGSFMTSDQLSLDHGAFGISLAEARSMDPQQSLVLSVGYSALIKGSNSIV
jgi:acyl carrier protein